MDAPIVLLHGWGGSRRMWAPVVRELADAGLESVCVELPGHGDAAELAGGYSIAEQAEDVARRIEEAGVPAGATVAGHSLGGVVAVAIAEREPGRIGRLALIDSPPTMDDRRLGLFGRSTFWPLVGQGVWRLGRALPEAFVRSSFEIFFAPGTPVAQEQVDGVRSLSYRTYRGASVAIQAYVSERSLPDRIADLGVPLLALWGEHDVFWLPSALERFRSVPGARLETIEGAGHTPMLERPRETAALLAEFATATAPASA